MLDSRFLGIGRRPQPMPSDVYTSRVIVMRKKLAGLTDPFSGELGENQIEYEVVVRGWPASITMMREDVRMTHAGQTEKAEYVLLCQYKRMKDGGLLIRERDIIIDMHNQQRMLVLWSYDPMNTHVHIMAGVEFGTLNYDLDRQG